jgi:pre-rRNA-processing protein TSR3
MGREGDEETTRMGDLTRRVRPSPSLPLSPSPPTVIVVHPRERRKKCTVRALRSRDGFAFCNFPRMPYDLTGYVRLGLGGLQLSEADSERGLLVLDGTWRHVQPMERMFAAISIRSLPPLVTAYPRASKVSTDPDGGLATIEAIYAAYRLLGRDTSGLLDHYHWADEFVAINSDWWPVGRTNEG